MRDTEEFWSKPSRLEEKAMKMLAVIVVAVMLMIAVNHITVGNKVAGRIETLTENK